MITVIYKRYYSNIEQPNKQSFFDMLSSNSATSIRLDGEVLFIDDTMEIETDGYDVDNMKKDVTLVLKSGDIVNTLVLNLFLVNTSCCFEIISKSSTPNTIDPIKNLVCFSCPITFYKSFERLHCHLNVNIS